MGYDDDEGSGFDKPVEEGKTYTVEIDDLGSKGDGIARVDGFVVFVPETEVGEAVEVEVNSVGRKFAFAEVVDRDVEPVEDEDEDVEEVDEVEDGDDEDLGVEEPEDEEFDDVEDDVEDELEEDDDVEDDEDIEVEELNDDEEDFDPEVEEPFDEEDEL